MEAFKEVNKKRSSQLQLIEYQENDSTGVVLSAVNSVTGDVIAGLIDFKPDGEVLVINHAKERLESSDYNPYEHGNRFDRDGSIRLYKDETIE